MRRGNRQSLSFSANRMRRRTTEKRAAILNALVEGNSINATARMTGASKITILRLLADAGQFCADYHDVYVRGLSSKRVQMDELWAFCGCKDKAKKAGALGARQRVDLGWHGRRFQAVHQLLDRGSGARVPKCSCGTWRAGWKTGFS